MPAVTSGYDVGECASHTWPRDRIFPLDFSKYLRAPGLIVGSTISKLKAIKYLVVEVAT
jgi:hypothetical protein